jgi:apolipoprotein D and lipocalin family protein
MTMKTLLSLLLVLFTGCVRMPERIQPVENFELQRYLGRWYEIARLDHSFERGLTNVTADYSLREDGSVRVLNRGFSTRSNSWKEAEGKALFVGRSDQGYLKVSFFGPFYGAYVIFALDHEQYQYALVCGPDRSYLWLLARSPDLPADLRQRLIDRAAALGFATGELIMVEHDRASLPSGNAPAQQPDR